MDQEKRGREFDPESLRPLKYVMEPDPRSPRRTIYRTHRRKKLTIGYYYKKISRIKLKPYVPERIQIQFDVARNLFLYSWFIYRFYPVSESHVLSCLEFALRERYGNAIPKKYYKNPKMPTLRALLNYAIDIKGIRKENFPDWHMAAKRKAQARYENERFLEMIKKGLKSITIDLSEVKVEEVDRTWDPVANLKEYLPNLRNTYAHGTEMLQLKSANIFKYVAEIINQIYEPVNK